MRKSGAGLTVWLVPFVLVLGLNVACASVRAAQEPRATPTPLPTPVTPQQSRYTVQRGSVLNTLSFAGRVSAVREEQLFFRTDGFVDSVAVAIGDDVRAGDLLAELDVSVLRAELARAELALRRSEMLLAQAEVDHEQALVEARVRLQQAQAQLQQARAGGASAALTSAEVNVSRAEENLAYWQYEYQKAVDRPWEPQASLDNYARQLRQAEENLEIARAQREAALGDRSASAYAIQLREYDVQLAQLALQELEAGPDPLLALDVEEARLEVTRLQERLAAAQLTAPFAGRVTSLALQPGDAVTAYDPLALIADPRTLEVTADPGTEALGDVTVGMTATVTLRQRPQAPMTGTVRQLPGAFGASLADQDRFVHIALPQEQPSAQLSLGELANVTLLLQARHDVLWLPPAAIRTFQGRTFVVVEQTEGQRRLDVRLGIEGSERVEIVEGLEEGMVVLGP